MMQNEWIALRVFAVCYGLVAFLPNRRSFMACVGGILLSIAGDARSGDEALKALVEKYGAAAGADSRRVDKVLSELGAPEFNRRKAAQAQAQALAPADFVALMKRLRESDDPELKGAIQDLEPVQTNRPVVRLASITAVRRALAGDPDAAGEVSALYRRGDWCLKVDPAAALAWATRSADKGSAMGQYNLACLLFSGLGAEVDRSRAMDRYRACRPGLRALAEKGDPKAQCWLGQVYCNGLGGESNLTEGVQWIQRAAAQDDPEAQGLLGLLFLAGLGVESDIKVGMEWLQKAADQDDPEGHYNLAVTLARGALVRKDIPAMRKHLECAAEQNLPEALDMLGTAWCGGMGLGSDGLKAREYYRRAADLGHANAQYHLGLSLINGIPGDEGEEEDRRQADGVAWVKQAALRQHGVAQYLLGLMYRGGEVVPKAEKEAFRWFRAAVSNDFWPAEYQLGWMYGQGKGVAKSDEEAARWYQKGADRDEPGALNDLAWLFATSKNAKLHDGKKAVLLAERACSLQGDYHAFVDTLAAALARDGQFDKAVEIQKRAIILMEQQLGQDGIDDDQVPELRKGFQQRLELYEQKKPFEE